jgi:hypothetical protein
MPKEFRKALEHSQWHESSLHEALRTEIGVDHAVVGAMLVEKWRFPPSLVETIANQHGPELKDTDMIACVFAANQTAKKLQFGFGGNPCVEELSPAMQKRLGGTLAEVIAALGDLRHCSKKQNSPSYNGGTSDHQRGRPPRHCDCRFAGDLSRHCERSKQSSMQFAPLRPLASQKNATQGTRHAHRRLFKQ